MSNTHDSDPVDDDWPDPDVSAPTSDVAEGGTPEPSGGDEFESDDHESADDSESTDDSESADAESKLSRKRFVGMFVGMFVGIGIFGLLAYVLFVGGAEDDAAATQSIAPEPPNTATVADDFTRPDSATSLGAASSGQSWEALSGTWGVIDEQAYVATKSAEGGGWSLAVIDMGSGNGSVTATATSIAKGWGIVFRYRGPFNYWMLQASTEHATYNLVKVIDGELMPVTQGGIGLAPMKDGTTVGVQLQGATISVMLNDRAVEVFRDGDLQSMTKVGMIVSAGGADTARWDDFTAQADPPGGAAGDGD